MESEKSKDFINQVKESFSLTKAQKLLTKLKLYIDKNKQLELNAQQYIINMQSNVSLLETAETNLNVILAKKESLQKKFNNFISIYNDFCKFKTSVHSQNAQSGLDNILTEIEILQNLKKTYELIAQNSNVIIPITHAININHVNHLMSELKRNLSEKDFSGSLNSMNINISVFEESRLLSLITKINKELDVLETQRDHLNAISKVCYNFCDATKNILGL